jgi:hypothetical protein
MSDIKHATNGRNENPISECEKNGLLVAWMMSLGATMLSMPPGSANYKSRREN